LLILTLVAQHNHTHRVDFITLFILFLTHQVCREDNRVIRLTNSGVPGCY